MIKNPIAKVFDISFDIECCGVIDIILPYMGDKVPISYKCIDCDTVFIFHVKKKNLTFEVKMNVDKSNKRNTLF